MAFEPVNKDSAANFRGTGTPGEPDLFTPRLTLRQEESQSMTLTDLPGVLAVPGVNVPGIAPAIMPAPPPPDFKIDPPKIASVEQEFIGRNLFKVTGRAPGVARIHAEGRAFLINAPFVAELIVTVIDKLPQPDPSDLIGGFVEGLSKSASPAIQTLTNKLTSAAFNRRDIGNILPVPLFQTPIILPASSLIISFQMGYIKGLWAGLKDLFDLPSLGDLKELAETVSKVMGPFAALNLPNGQLNPQVAKFIERLNLKVRGREIGKILGEELGKEINDQVTQKSAE